jgi:porphobilinogen synthase
MSRLRRRRDHPWLRASLREFEPQVGQMVQPLFCVEGISKPEAVPGLTGTFRDTPESLLTQIERDLEAGIHQFLLFGVPKNKVKDSSLKQDGAGDFTSRQIAAIKRRFGDQVWLAVDVCLCSTTEHGHCGILSHEGDHVQNDATVEQLARMALEYAKAGADCLAPSDMMDGRVGAIRDLLDENGFERASILSYSAKFHSKFYGPFRVAADSAPKNAAEQPRMLKDRATYQIDPGSPRDALASSLRDLDEGADFLMVKPGMPYLDVLQDLSREISTVPWAVYQVSGEFAAIELLAEKGLMDRVGAHREAWTAFRRAGASMIITYGARYAKDWLKS